MKQSIVHVALVVRDYDEAIAFYTQKLDFTLVEDTYQPEQDKRWVVVSPPGSKGTTLLLARASKPEQEPFVGNQAGGRVFLFLETDDFRRDYDKMLARGITFVREPKSEPYGIVAVFQDLYGTLWDLVERAPARPASRGASRPDERARTSVFVGVSVDGFIARKKGEIDWLPEDAEPHGYDEFIATVDAIVMGRATFDVVMGFDAWPYGDKRVVVLSSGPVDLAGAVARGGIVEQMGGSPHEIVATLSARGARHLYIDGGLTLQGFLRAGLIDRMIVTRVPVLIGEGIPLFGSVPHDIRLHHVATRSFPSGLVQSEYELKP